MLLVLQGDFPVNPNATNYSQKIEQRLGIDTESKRLPPKRPHQHEVYFSQNNVNTTRKGTHTMTYLESATPKAKITEPHDDYTKVASNEHALLDTTTKTMSKLKQRIDEQSTLLEDIAHSIYKQSQSIQNIESIHTNQSKLIIESLRERLPENSKSLTKLTLAVLQNTNNNRTDKPRFRNLPGGKQVYPSKSIEVLFIFWLLVGTHN